jgi:hypothetical protein
LATPSDLGQAGEFLVASDLLTRGLAVTKSLNTNGVHDLHAKCSGSWLTIQVKCGRVNQNTQRLSTPGNYKGIRESDILASVDLADKRIRYFPVSIPALPQELM